MLRWTVNRRRDREISVVFEGDISERVNFADLELPEGRVIFDFGGVRRLNSAGIHKLIRFLESLDEARDIEAENCSPPFVAQLNLLPTLSGQLRVRSIAVPLECPSCGAEAEVFTLVGLSGEEPEPPYRRCDDCESDMVMAEPAERYFAFLR
jgi:hypothetical protein